jgi:single-strand DNA-binding protein
MARGLNKVILIGNLGADPEIKYTPGGTAIANLRFATNENRKNREGEWGEMTEWHRVVMFGKQAETCKDYLKKGSRLYLEGRIQTRSWDDQSGKKQYMTEIVGQTMIMLDSRHDDNTSAGSSKPSSQPEPSHQQSENYRDDDLPF